jgi:hypothetical protein
MQVANFQVFALLVVVGLLIFFSSFLTLDLHTSVEELTKLPGHEFFHKPRVHSTSFLDATHNLKDFTAEESVAAAALKLSSRFNEFQHAILPTTTDHSVDYTHEITGFEAPGAASKQCSITFPQKCRINPLLKYWDEVMECYTSPLRQFNGLAAPKENQKFIVFQPDSGGWNNIRMALEVVILFAQVSVCTVGLLWMPVPCTVYSESALRGRHRSSSSRLVRLRAQLAVALLIAVQVTGRILVLPPNAVLYLLHMNKKWGDNKSGMEDYFDFEKLRASKGLETMPMATFLRDFATTDNGGPLLSKPVPNNDVNLLRKPLWDYLDSACYSQNWSPGKLYVGFNISMLASGADLPGDTDPNTLVGTFESTDPARLEAFSLKRKISSA